MTKNNGDDIVDFGNFRWEPSDFGGRFSSGQARRSDVSDRTGLNAFSAHFPGVSSFSRNHPRVRRTRFDREQFVATNAQDPVVVGALYSRASCTRECPRPDRRVRQTTPALGHVIAVEPAHKCFGCFGRTSSSVGVGGGVKRRERRFRRAKRHALIIRAHEYEHATTAERAHPENRQMGR